jgi:hypothetical protein
VGAWRGAPRPRRGAAGTRARRRHFREKSRERNGLIELIKPPLRRGIRVKILHGPFRDHLAIFADMKPRARVEILLQILGGEQRVELARTDIEVISS